MTTLPNIKSLMLFQPHTLLSRINTLCSMREYGSQPTHTRLQEFLPLMVKSLRGGATTGSGFVVHESARPKTTLADHTPPRRRRTKDQSPADPAQNLVKRTGFQTLREKRMAASSNNQPAESLSDDRTRDDNAAEATTSAE